MILAGLLLAQHFITPSPIILTTPAPISERATLDKGLQDAQTHARALGGSLGVAIADVTTGVEAGLHDEDSFPMAGVQKLAVAVLVYRAIDAGDLHADESVEALISRMLIDDDDAATGTLIGMLHGSDAIDTQLHALHLDGLFVEPQDAGHATPRALLTLLREINGGSLLRAQSNAALLDLLAGVRTSPDRLRGGLPAHARLEHKTGTATTPGDAGDATDDVGIAEIPGHTLLIVALLRGAHGTQAQRDAVLADVARAAVAGATIAPIAP